MEYSFRERRKFPRVFAKFNISFRLKDDLKKADAFVTNISQGGIYLTTRKLLGPNDIIEILFTLPHDDKEYNIFGQVVRLVTYDDPDDSTKDIYGAGVKFVDINDEVQSAITEFVKKRQEKGAKTG